MSRAADYWDELARHGAEAAVIDPRDERGHKNRYIASLRDRVVLAALADLPPGARVLDLGCGSGSLSRTLARRGLRAVGLDVSRALLRFAREAGDAGAGSSAREGGGAGAGSAPAFARYDGRRLPFRADAFDACVTYGVLVYVTDDRALRALLAELRRVLRPGGRLAAVEQTARRPRRSRDGMKLQRPREEVLALLREAGFAGGSARLVRRGHFPPLYAIRYGLVPPALFAPLAAIEERLGRLLPTPRLDYADVLFEATAPPGPVGPESP